jgi:hypothetical protein
VTCYHLHVKRETLIKRAYRNTDHSRHKSPLKREEEIQRRRRRRRKRTSSS